MIKLVHFMAGLLFWGAILGLGSFQWDWQPTHDAPNGDGRLTARVAVGITVPPMVTMASQWALAVAQQPVQLAKAQQGEVKFGEWVQQRIQMAQGLIGGSEKPLVQPRLADMPSPNAMQNTATRYQ